MNRTQFLEGWLASEQAALDVITVKRIYIDINDGNLHDGLMFSQIMYWHGNSKETGKPRMTITRDGELWLAKAYTDWWEECRINEHTARKSINRIAARKLILTNLWKFDGAPTVHLRIDWNEFESRVKSIWHDVSNPSDTTGQLEVIPQVVSLTETTTTPTPEKKKRATRKTNFVLSAEANAVVEAFSKAQPGYSAEREDFFVDDAEWLAEHSHPQDVVESMAQLRKQDFWKMKVITLSYVKQHIAFEYHPNGNGNHNGKKYTVQQQILIAEQAAANDMTVDDYLAHVEAMQK